MSRIAQINDRFRRAAPIPELSGIPGRCVMTPGIAELDPAAIAAIFEKVRTFGSFTEDNDPHGEHDFGAIHQDGIGRIFWKIDYYAPDLRHGSEDPADLSQTVRVLTVMLAEEY